MRVESEFGIIAAGKVRVASVVFRLRELLQEHFKSSILDTLQQHALDDTADRKGVKSMKKRVISFKNYTKDPSCMLCTEEDGVNYRYLGGGDRSLAYRRKLNCKTK